MEKENTMGKVYLIGTGPGDEELLTLKAVKALNECTAVLYDRLISGNILKYLKEDCTIYYCGKEPGCHYKTQEEINDMLVKLALEGHTVGRIKGGDPYVFGRGGEEALRLVEENVDFEVIPGVTSAISVLNYAGIPATQRGMAQSFHVFTGMTKDKLNIDWDTVSKLEGTLIFLMGLKNIDLITRELIKSGKAENTPCAVIMRGTTSKQKKVVSDLKNIGTKIAEQGLKSPCIIVIGEVVNLSDKLSWYENKPLFGKNICITRSKEQSKSITNRLLSLGAEVTEINTIKIKPALENLEDYQHKLQSYDYIILTSVNAVKLFFQYINSKDIDIRTIKAKFAVVGKATAKELKEKGIIPYITAKQFVAEDLFESLKTVIKKGDKVMFPCSKEARSFIDKQLLNQGALVDRVHIYEPAPGDIKNCNSFQEVDIVIFTSPSTFKNLISMVGLEEIKKKQCIAIGPITEKSLKESGIDCYVCTEHSEDGIIKKLMEIYA